MMGEIALIAFVPEAPVLEKIPDKGIIFTPEKRAKC
jgi:hypothetical protein